MTGRKERYRQLKKKRLRKLKKMSLRIAGGMLLLLLLWGTPVLAGYDLSELLSSWFSNRVSDAQEELNQAILQEKEIQMGRLKTELLDRMGSQQAELDRFVQELKEGYSAALREYADQLIRQYGTENPDELARIEASLEQIIGRAIREMDSVYSINLEGNRQVIDPVSPPPPPPPPLPPPPSSVTDSVYGELT